MGRRVGGGRRHHVKPGHYFGTGARCNPGNAGTGYTAVPRYEAETEPYESNGYTAVARYEVGIDDGSNNVVGYAVDDLTGYYEFEEFRY